MRIQNGFLMKCTMDFPEGGKETPYAVVIVFGTDDPVHAERVAKARFTQYFAQPPEMVDQASMSDQENAVILIADVATISEDQVKFWENIGTVEDVLSKPKKEVA